MKRKSLLIAMMLCFVFLGVAKAQQRLPYSYGFEDNNLATDGWTTQNPSGLNASEFGIIGTAAQNGSYGFRFSSYNDRGESTQYLISPELNAPRGVVVQFSYKASSSYTSGETFQVGYSTTDTNISSFTFGTANNATNTTWAQTEEFIFPAGTKYVAVYYSANYQYRLYVDDFSFEENLPCAKPENLSVTTDGQTATVTWDGTASNGFIFNINGTDYTVQTSPYTFNVALSTTYNISVTSNCGSDGLSAPVSTSFTTPDCLGGHIINYALTDSYGDGWNGNAINVVDECGNPIATLTIDDGSSNNGTLSLCGDYYQFTWTAGSYASETSFTLLDNGVAIYSNQSGSSLTDGQVLYTIGTNTRLPRPTALTAGTPNYTNVDLSWTENGSATAWEICINGDESNLVPANTNVNFNLTGLQPDNSYSVKVRSVSGNEESCWSDEVTVTTPVACARPENLTESNLTFTTADLSWTGTANSYVAEYGIWAQAGTDQIATATLDPYTFDLSGFSGKGTVAIRHYNVTDMFYLNVDDIVVKDANGDVVYSEDFESGSIPANISNIDLDGDGYMWEMGTYGISGQSNITVNGHYGLYSASWDGDALNPDNWLVISDITLGGSITFKAVGQDPSVPYENFAVYVIADNQFTEAYNGTRTSCQVTGLTEGTAYAWRVQGDCGEYASNWVFSMFKTPDNLLIFATEGNWDNPRNWTDTEGNTATTLPTADNKVRIDADATIPAGLVATAKNVTLNGGSIEIEDGGQLKQGGTVKVTMHKAIEGYGANYNEETNNNGNYYFIATPHSCSYLEESTLFPYVLNLTDGEYDLYAFDATADLEWINYKNNPSHTEFHTGNNTGLFNKKGYLYANEDDTDLKYVGTVSSSLNNILTESFTYSETSTDDFNGWRLVGNPFTCDAYISYVDDNGDVLEANFYTLNNSNTYTESESSVALAPLTGALVNFSATGKVQFSSEAPAKANRTGMININLSRANKKVDQARVRFGHGFNMQHMSFRNNSKIYMPVDGNDYAVVYTEKQGEMPVSFKAEENGTYTLSINTENVEFGYLHLIDNLTGNDVDLLANPSYSFDARFTDYANRFKLVYTTATTANNDEFAFISNNHLMILGVDGQATLKVMDVTGRTLSTQTFSGNYDKAINMSNGVYMLQLIQGGNVKTQKIVVK